MDMLLGAVITVIAHPFALITLFSGNTNPEVLHIFLNMRLGYWFVFQCDRSIFSYFRPCRNADTPPPPHPQVSKSSLFSA